MGEAIGEILPAAIGVAVSPVPIIGVILMLFSTRAGANSASFLAGWVAGVVGASVVVLAIAQSQDLQQSSGDPETWVSLVKAALGALLLLASVKQFRSRPEGDEAPTLPKWMQGIDTLTPGKAFVLGGLLAAVNPKNLMLIVSAAVTIAQAELSGGDDALVVAVFSVIACSTVAAPVVLFRALGARAEPTLSAMKGWLIRNNAVVMAVLLLVLGAKLFGDGIGPLL